MPHVDGNARHWNDSQEIMISMPAHGWQGQEFIEGISRILQNPVFIIRFEKLTAIFRYSPLLDKAMCFSLAGLSECFQLQCIDQFLWTGWPMAISMGALSGAVRVGDMRRPVEQSNCFEGKCMQKL